MSAAAFGIDVSKASLTGSWVEHSPASTTAHARSAPERVRWSKEVPNSEVGIQHYLEAIPPEVPWVIEPTGRYSTLVAATARAAGRQVLLAEPKRAKHFLASLRGGLKTDLLDSRGLAIYGLHRPLPPYPLKSATVARLDELQAARKGLSLSISRLKQQAEALPHARAGLLTAIEHLETQRQEFDNQIAEVLSENQLAPMLKKLRAVPGVGP